MFGLLDPVTLYAQAVTTGAEVAGPWVRAACRRHLNDLANGAARGLWFDHTRAAKAFQFFQEELKLSEGQFEGRDFRLEPSQFFIIGSIFGWMRMNERGEKVRRFRRVYIEQGKGNGKSPMVGGIGLYGMMADNEPGAQIYSAGATFDQASILFNDAVKMAQQSADLWENITPSGNAKILNLAALGSPWHGAFFRPLSREKSRTGSGPRPHMALCDELHEHPDGGVIEMLERGFKFRRQPLLVMITNSGSDRKSICWEEHEHAIAAATGAVQDDSTFSYVCALDEGDDPLVDDTCWKKANPLLGVTITYEYLRGVVKQALDLPSKQNNILRLHFCEWTDSATAWLPRAKLEACEDPEMKLEDFAGKRCFGGLDLSATKDMTAKALVFDDGWKDVPDPENPHIVKRKPTYALFVKCWTPAETLKERAKADKAPYGQWVKEGHLVETPGPVIRLDFVAWDLKEDHDRFELAGVAYDRYLIRAFEKEMAELAIDQVVPMHDHPQSVARRQQTELWMPGSVDMFETLILEQRIRIAVSPVLRSAIAGATFWESPAGLKRFEKSKATCRIDACVAAAMAIGLATQGEEARVSVYDTLNAHEAALPKTSVYDELELDYKILNDPNHPKHHEMLRRFYRKEALEDAELELA
jgi:phage terminase large subunit-like protein